MQDQGKTEGLAACESQAASPFGCLNIFYFKILSNFLGSIHGSPYLSPYLSTNTLKIQRIPISLTLTSAQTAAAPTKRTKPRRRTALQRGSLYDGTAEKPYFKRFSGIEKDHRNSIKITVVLCEDRTIEMFLRFRCLDLNTRHNHSTSLRFCFQGCLQRHLDFGAADKDHLDFLF